MKIRFTVGNKIRFAIISIVFAIAVSISVYFPLKQEGLLVESYGEKIKSLAETVSLGVTIGLQNGDMGATQKAFDFAKFFHEYKILS